MSENVDKNPILDRRRLIQTSLVGAAVIVGTSAVLSLVDCFEMWVRESNREEFLKQRATERGLVWSNVEKVASEVRSKLGSKNALGKADASGGVWLDSVEAGVVTGKVYVASVGSGFYMQELSSTALITTVEAYRDSNGFMVETRVDYAASGDYKTRAVEFYNNGLVRVSELDAKFGSGAMGGGPDTSHAVEFAETALDYAGQVIGRAQ